MKFKVKKKKVCKSNNQRNISNNNVDLKTFEYLNVQYKPYSMNNSFVMTSRNYYFCKRMNIKKYLVRKKLAVSK